MEKFLCYCLRNFSHKRLCGKFINCSKCDKITHWNLFTMRRNFDINPERNIYICTNSDNKRYLPSVFANCISIRRSFNPNSHKWFILQYIFNCWKKENLATGENCSIFRGKIRSYFYMMFALCMLLYSSLVNLLLHSLNIIFLSS